MDYGWKTRIMLKPINFYFTFFFLGTFAFYSQATLVQTNNAKLTFSAGKNAEPIKAETNKTKLVLNTENGEIACLVKIVAFNFSNKLMQEHFNENYLESNRYPTATFSGTILNFSSKNIRSSSDFKVKGFFKIHGETHEEIIDLKVTKTKKAYLLSSNFELKLEDFDIKIPKIMFYKIAETVAVSLEAELIK